MNPFLKRVSLDSHYWINNLGYSPTTIFPLTLVSHILKSFPMSSRNSWKHFFFLDHFLCVYNTVCADMCLFSFQLAATLPTQDAMEHCKPIMCGTRIISTQLCFDSNFCGKTFMRTRSYTENYQNPYNRAIYGNIFALGRASLN